MLKRFAIRTFKSEIEKEVAKQVALSVTESDNTFYPSAASNLYRDRFDFDRITIVNEALRAWRINPIARRLVELTNQFVLGADGINWSCKHKHTSKFIDEFWNHRLNQLDIQISEWLDELTRSGDLFLLFSVDDAGMSFIRAIPPEQIKDIQTRENDYRQELYYIKTAIDETPYPAYDPTDAEQKSFVLHYAVNRPAGAVWGESDLAPVLKWIGHYSSWLENRAMLNRFRTAFMFVLRGQFQSESDKKKRQAELNANPPRSGSVLVTDPSEEWGTLSANLDAFDASADGLSIKKNIALGAGIPMHFLAEPESSTRTTAEAAGTPTFRRFEQRQKYLLWMLEDVLKTVITIRKRHDARVKTDADIELRGNDISERDNAALALAASQIETTFGDLYDRGLIDEQEFMRLVYRFSGEVLDTDQPIPKGIRKSVNTDWRRSPTAAKQPEPVAKAKVDKETGDVTAPAENQ